jgi:hypothetical protein
MALLKDGGQKMKTLDELIQKLTHESAKGRYSKAKTDKTCILCRNPAVRFRTTVAKLEYNVSALCQDCQDKYFQ